jgi:aquaporin Z
MSTEPVQKLITPPDVGSGVSPMAYLAELLGTFFFLLVILTKGEAVPIAIGLLASIYAFGGLSGGHFNPAVSLVFFAKGDFNEPGSVTFGRYVGAQVYGAIFALVVFNHLH